MSVQEVLDSIFSNDDLDTAPFFRTFALKRKSNLMKTRISLPNIWRDWEKTQNIQSSPQVDSVLKIEKNMIDLQTEFIFSGYKVKEVLSPGGAFCVVYISLGPMIHKNYAHLNSVKIDAFNKKQDSDSIINPPYDIFAQPSVYPTNPLSPMSPNYYNPTSPSSPMSPNCPTNPSSPTSLNYPMSPNYYNPTSPPPPISPHCPTDLPSPMSLDCPTSLSSPTSLDYPMSLGCSLDYYNPTSP